MLDNFGNRLVEELRKQNITQKELSAKAKISNSNLSKWIKGKIIPSVRSIEKIAKALNIPTSNLTNCENNHNINQIIGNNNHDIQLNNK